MSDNYTNRLDDQRRSSDADQAEIAAIRRGSSVADAGLHDERLAGVLDDEAESVRASSSWQAKDMVLEEAVGAVAEEFVRRRKIMGAAYPFLIQDGTAVYKPSADGFYEFCLATVSAPTITTGDYVKLPRTFERVVTVLMRSYMGVHSEALHTGSPRDKEVGTTFRAAVDKVHQMSSEWRWNPEETLPEDHLSPGDEGVDFVVWKKSLDGRPGQLFLVGQCACGNDWPNKFKDTDLERIYKWLNPRPHPPAMRAFATPFHISDGNLIEANRSAGLVFDRARLTLVAAAGGAAEIGTLSEQMRSLTNLVIKGAH